ncbi:Hypothetical protein POVR1_LOCUS524 [uncultured virus]|nr:Hypothetical protein POVR1_LOCUS524 [uncultured virus]
MIDSYSVYYELFLRLDYHQLLKFGTCLQPDPNLKEIILKVVTNDCFWYQKLSMEIETFNDPSVHWARAYKFLQSPKYYNQLLIDAAGDGWLAEVKLLMLNGVNPNVQENLAIREASGSGHLAVVNRLLDDPRVDPSAHDNEAVRWAGKGGRLAVVNRLLQDPRVDPGARNNEAIRGASMRGHSTVVDRLLQDSRVDPTIYAIILASRYGHLEVVNRLLEDKRVDPSALNNEAIRAARNKGHQVIVDRLREDSRVSSLT